MQSEPAPGSNSWVSTLDTYPTNDYALLDLFTAAPNDNAARGLLSVNQTNSAPWYALFSRGCHQHQRPPPGTRRPSASATSAWCWIQPTSPLCWMA